MASNTKSSAPWVYIPQDSPSKDFSEATRYGVIRTLVLASESRRPSQELLEIIEERLAASNENDFIVPVGDPVIIGLVIFTMLDMHGKINILRWNAVEANYNQETITV